MINSFDILTDLWNMDLWDDYHYTFRNMS